MTPAAPAVSIANLHKSYGAVRALTDISFTIRQGEFFGLLGPNGAGKSTLISALAGLVRPDAGTLEVTGFDVATQYRDARRRLGVVPQELVYDPFFTARESLQIQAGYFGLGREAHPWIEELLSALKLTDKADTNMRALSGGMKRRVLICQALVHKPPVVVLDEPTAGVDVDLRQSLWDFIRRLHSEGHTIVLTTHYLEEAEELCDRIAILDHGRLIALENKADLLKRGIQRRLHVYAAQEITVVPPALADMVQQVSGQTMSLRLRRDTDSVVAVLDIIRAAGIEIVDLRMEEDDLETVFMQLTGGRARRK